MIGFNANFVAATDGTQNKYLLLLGTYLEAPPAVYFSGDLTVTVWIKPLTNKYWTRVFDFGNGQSADNVALSSSTVADGKPTFTIFTNGDSQIKSNTALQLNIWSYLAVTLSGNIGTIYIDGVIVASSSLNRPNNVLRTKNYIGKSNWAGDNMADQYLRMFKIYNRALTQSEIISSRVF